MTAKELLKKHLDIHMPKGVWMSEKQIEQAKSEAVLGAITEALEGNKKLSTREEAMDKSLQIVSKDGAVDYGNLDPIAKATWNSYQKGFMQAWEIIKES